jgi:cytochrome c oxidase subunit 3
VKQGAVRDFSHLPDYAFGHRTPVWWGTLGFMVIEGSGFVAIVAVYFYLASQNPNWPLAVAPPTPWIGTALTVFLLLTEVPNFWVKRVVKRLDLKAARIGVTLMAVLGLGAFALRMVEFGQLNCSWTTNAYGSTVWAILFLHTTHIIADFVETCVMAVMTFAGPMDARRFVDLSENAEYWDFVVLAWIPLYVVIYWLPRMLG